MLITTGSQGEPAAALSRIAAGEHRQIRIAPGDTVVMAATPVPGNEETVGRTIDNLFRAGADVLYPSITPNIHVSGHAAREEHRELLAHGAPALCCAVPRRVPHDGACSSAWPWSRAFRRKMC